MAWTDLTYDFGSLLTSTKMTQLQANFAAMGAHEAGSPLMRQSLAFDMGTTLSNSGSQTLTTYGQVYTNIPTEANTLEFNFDLRNTVGGSTAGARFTVNGSATAEQTVVGTTFTEKNFGLDVSSIEGWVTTELQIRSVTAGGAVRGEVRSPAVIYK